MRPVLRTELSGVSFSSKSRVSGSLAYHVTSIAFVMVVPLVVFSGSVVANRLSVGVLVVVVSGVVGTPTSRSSRWFSSTGSPGAGLQDNMSGALFCTPGICMVV